jgi:pimeloyl-ACP methyl ester carboxylesterase
MSASAIGETLPPFAKCKKREPGAEGKQVPVLVQEIAMARHVLVGLVVTLILGGLALAGMIAFGGPKPPPVSQSLAAHDNVIVASLVTQPPPETFKARDGADLSYRRYPGAADGGVAVLVHGSSGNNAATHRMAEGLARAGVTVFAIDVRGHGASGRHGDIVYYGQLDDDIADLAKMIDQRLPNERRLLIGHSSGGGFALRIAGGKYACAFDGFIALSPYLNYRSPTNRPNGGWAGPGIARIVGLSILNRFGVTAFDGLPALAFAIPADLPNRTHFYSWRLMRNFGLNMDGWENEIKAIDRPTRVLIGANDELFFADQYPATFAKLQPRIGMSVVPGADHMGMIVDDSAIAKVTTETKAMLAATPAKPRC